MRTANTVTAYDCAKWERENTASEMRRKRRTVALAIAYGVVCASLWFVVGSWCIDLANGTDRFPKLAFLDLR